MKICTECQQTKQNNQFTKSKNKKRFFCDECYRKRMNSHQAKYRQNKKEQIRINAKAQRIKAFDSRAEYNRKWKEKNYEKDLNRELKYTYNITIEKYKDLLEKQEYKCAICKSECNIWKRLSVDHDHSCCPGTRSCGWCVRGLLCQKCNHGLGFFEDSEIKIAEALQYLHSFNSLKKSREALEPKVEPCPVVLLTR